MQGCHLTVRWFSFAVGALSISVVGALAAGCGGEGPDGPADRSSTVATSSRCLTIGEEVFVDELFQPTDPRNSAVSYAASKAFDGRLTVQRDPIDDCNNLVSVPEYKFVTKSDAATLRFSLFVSSQYNDTLALIVQDINNATITPTDDPVWEQLPAPANWTRLSQRYELKDLGGDMYWLHVEPKADQNWQVAEAIDDTLIINYTLIVELIEGELIPASWVSGRG